MYNILFRPGYHRTILFLLLSFTLFLSTACTSTHQTYVYRGPGMFNGVWHPGEKLTIQWTAEAGPALAEDEPSTVILQVSLLGPFKDSDGILNPLRIYGHDAPLSRIGPTAAATVPLKTDNWTKKDFTATLTFPTQLRAGFYDLVVMATVTPDKSSSTRTDTPIQVF
jgi:hypothetical protein